MILPALPFFLLYAVLNVILCWQDYRTGLLRNCFTCPLLWGGLLSQLCLNPTKSNEALWGAIAGYCTMALFYWGYRALRRCEGLGYGDVKYVAALGTWHGWQSLPLLVLVATLLACAFIAGKALWLHQAANIKNPLPFGPFLGAAGFIMAGLSAFNLQP
ncbi:prepilin peptidase [Kluyvera sichuanensis]